MTGDFKLQRELRAAQARAQVAEERILEEKHERQAVEDRLFEAKRENKAIKERLLEEKHERRAAEERLYEERCLRQAEERERRLTLAGYLHAYHTVDKLDMKYTRDSAECSQVHAQRAAQRLCPRYITPWHNFPDEIIGIYDTLKDNSNFLDGTMFPTFPPFGSESANNDEDLKRRQQVFVIDAVDVLLRKVCEDPTLRDLFDIAADGNVSFDDLHKHLKNVPIREKPKGSASYRVNQWCEYTTPDVEKKLILSVLYEEPSWLKPSLMAMGLDGVNAIELSHVMNPNHPAGDLLSDNFITFEARRLVAAVITQLFDMMIQQKVRFGYIDTADAKIFLRIGEDPSCVEYFLAIPSDDVEVEGEAEPLLHLTSVAEVFAFTLLAFQSPAPDQDWIDETKALGRWNEASDMSPDFPPPALRKPPHERQGARHYPFSTEQEQDVPASHEEDNEAEYIHPRVRLRNSYYMNMPPIRPGAVRHRMRQMFGEDSLEE
ncbi:hypothetical protein E4U40_006179 [Claviceps sp. LM458 group G5]|nr:hypothetical protein E4U40_006179 [Claviceps sp. LM458 group G5]